MLAGSRPWEGEGFMGAMFKVCPAVTLGGISYDSLSMSLAARCRANAPASSAGRQPVRLRRPVRQRLPPNVRVGSSTLSTEHDADRRNSCRSESERRPKASEAKHHPFLTTLDPNWSFTQSSLYQYVLSLSSIEAAADAGSYRIMTAEEERRRAPNTPSAS